MLKSLKLLTLLPLLNVLNVYLLVSCSIISVLPFLLILRIILLHLVNWTYSLCKLQLVAYKIFPVDNFPNFSIAFKNEISCPLFRDHMSGKSFCLYLKMNQPIKKYSLSSLVFPLTTQYQITNKSAHILYMLCQ